MKAEIIYSSSTGNTRAVVDAIHGILPANTAIINLKEMTEETNAELLVLGFWVDKSQPDKTMLKYMEGLKDKNIIALGTMGGYPDSPYAEKIKNNILEILEDKNNVLGISLCQGRIDPKITAMFDKMGGKNGMHEMTPDRIQRHLDAANHPNEEDFEAARRFVQQISENLKIGA